MIRTFDLFTPTPIEHLVRKELDEARRALLEAQTHRDFAESVIIYNETRIRRLENGHPCTT